MKGLRVYCSLNVKRRNASKLLQGCDFPRPRANGFGNALQAMSLFIVDVFLSWLIQCQRTSAVGRRLGQWQMRLQPLLNQEASLRLSYQEAAGKCAHLASNKANLNPMATASP